MMIEIENFTTTTGWASDGTLIAYALNEHPDFIANNLDYSLVIEIPAGNLNKSIEKTIDLDLSDYNEIAFSIWSRNMYKDVYKKASDFYYKINFGGSDSYFVETTNRLQQIQLGISEGNVTKIKITALHNEEDYIVLSWMVAVYEEMPLDIYTTFKSNIEYELENKYGNGIFISKINAEIGDTEIQIASDHIYLNRYAVIKITDGINTEIHQIGDYSEKVIKFTSMYDGLEILNDFSNADLYLIIPVEYGRDSTEIILPGVVVWGITPEPIWRGAALEDVFDTFKVDTTNKIRREGKIQKYNILVDCEAHHYELVNFMSKIIRDWIAKQIFWCNGLKLEINNEGTPTEVEPVTAVENIPKIQYTFSVEIKEEIFQRETQNPITVDYLKFYYQ